MQRRGKSVPQVITRKVLNANLFAKLVIVICAMPQYVSAEIIDQPDYDHRSVFRVTNGQSFTATSNNPVKVGFLFARFSTTAIGDGIVEAQLLSGDGLDGSVLSTSVVDLSGPLPSDPPPLPGGELIEFSFLDTALTKDDIYTATIITSDNSLTVYWFEGDIYEGGRMHEATRVTPFGPRPPFCDAASCDMAFRVTPVPISGFSVLSTFIFTLPFIFTARRIRS